MWILSDFFLTVDTKVSLKSIFGIYKNLCATTLAIDLTINPSGLYLTLNTHFDLIVFCPRGSSLYS